MTKITSLFVLLATFIALVLPGALPAHALTAAQQSVVERVEAYLQGLTRFSARFRQVNQEGAVAVGDFHLSRPGKMKIDYDPPNQYLIVADGVWLTFWDGRLGRRSDILLGSTIVDVLTREPVRLGGSGGDVTVAAAIETETTLEVTLHETEDPQAGILTLVLGKVGDGLEIQGWRMIDSRNQTVDVTLSAIDYAVGFERDFFRAPRPRDDRRDD